VTLRERGIAIDSFNVQKPSLDEVFMVLTGHGAADDDAEPETTSTELEAVR
jgi:ABC-2 type transport system ATP-binding protein